MIRGTNVIRLSWRHEVSSWPLGKQTQHQRRPQPQRAVHSSPLTSSFHPFAINNQNNQSSWSCLHPHKRPSTSNTLAEPFLFAAPEIVLTATASTSTSTQYLTVGRVMLPYWLRTRGGGGGLFRPTFSCLSPHLPSHAEAVHTHTSTYTAAARELALLSQDDFMSRVHRFSRNNFDPSMRHLVHAHLMELLAHRASTLPVRIVHNYTHLAHVAGFHELCLAIFHVRRQATPASDGTPSATAFNTVQSSLTPHLQLGSSALFIVSEYIVDSAYAMRDSTELVRLATFCAHHISELRTKEMGGRDVMAEFSLLRTLWRTMCLSEVFAAAEMHGGATSPCAGAADCGGGDRDSGGSSSSSSSAQALADAATIYEDFVLSALGGGEGGGNTSSNNHPRRHGDTDAVVRCIRRLIKYDTSGDDGEFMFFQWCMNEGLLVVPSAPASRGGRRYTGEDTRTNTSASRNGQQSGEIRDNADEGDQSTASFIATTSSFAPERPGLGSSGDVVDADYTFGTGSSSAFDFESSLRVSSPMEVFYATMISFCERGNHVVAAMLLYDAARRSLGLEGSLEDTNTGGFRMTLGSSSSSNDGGCSAAADVALSKDEAKGREEEDKAAATITVPHMAEYVIYRLLTVLFASKDNRRIIRLARALLADRATIGTRVWSLLLVAAGETRSADIALVAYRTALSGLSEDNVASVAMGGSGLRSASHLLYPGSQQGRQRMEYLLQTALGALSKCQIPNFEADYLQPAQEAGLLHCTEEFYFCCLLQDAHNSLNPSERAAAVVERINARGVPLTVPLVSRLLRLYLRIEAPEFLQMYGYVVQDLKLFKQSWLGELLLWADRRRYFLTQDDRAFILAEVEDRTQHQGSGGSSSVLSGLRTQHALLVYDYEHCPREHFLSTGRPCCTEPSMPDSRVHFVLRRPECVLRGLSPSTPTVTVVPGAKQQQARLLALSNAHDVGSAVADQDLVDTALAAALSAVAGKFLIGDPESTSSVARVADLSGASLLAPGGALGISFSASSSGGGGSSRNVTEERQEAALRVYLADVLEGLQRSHNYVS